MFSTLDILKAFDKIYHPNLVFKMTKLGVYDNILELIDSFLTENSMWSSMVEGLIL